jgi:tetratricopeptide (TPR) repeat protein
MELRFEQSCLQLVADEDWDQLEAFAVEHLDKCKAKSSLGFLYLGVALYKAGRYDSAVQAYQKSAELDPKNAQVQYNLGLAYFKEEAYTLAVEHLKTCI